MPAVALLSAFTHHLTTTAAMLPVTLKLCREQNIRPSKLLMPLSFAASLGTTITIIGAPAFLIASGILQQAGQPGLGIFSIAPVGLALSAAGTAFVLLTGRFLLPERGAGEHVDDHFRLDNYFTELTIQPEARLLGRTVSELKATSACTCGRGLATPRPPLDRPPRRASAGGRRRVAGAHHPGGPGGDPPGARDRTASAAAVRGDDDGGSHRLAQAVVAPGSDLVAHSLGGIDFRRRYGALVLGLWRRAGWLDEEPARTRLRAGDVLVLQGNDEPLARVANDPGFLMLLPFRGEPKARGKASVAASSRR
jgi:di/tricarboxylate transporter